MRPTLFVLLVASLLSGCSNGPADGAVTPLCTAAAATIARATHHLECPEPCR